MKKLFFFVPIIFLIFATTLTKNSTKKLDKEIFQLKENIRILDDRYELTLLDYSILTSPKKLMEYQQFYFDDKFIQKKIENLSKIELNYEDYLFHAGTLEKEGKIFSMGGRVLNFVSLSNEFINARENVNKYLNKLNWTGGFYRKDIGYKVINK